MEQLILCDIGEAVTFAISGKFQKVDFNNIFLPENRCRIYRIQFHVPPQKRQLERVVELIREIPNIGLRFYGQFSEESIAWSLLADVERLQVDLWETQNLNQLRKLTNLRELGILKQVKSQVSLELLKDLPNLEVLFTSISKDVDSISELKRLRFLSLSEIKTKNLDFLQGLECLNDFWLSLGSVESFGPLTNNKAIKNLRIHQVRGFNDAEAEIMFANGQSLQALSLENLKHLTNLDFVRNLTSLRLLHLDGIKNLKTYEPLEMLDHSSTFTAYNSRPLDRSLSPLRNLNTVGIGDSYDSRTIKSFEDSFNGEVLNYRGKCIRGEWVSSTPFVSPVF